MARAQRAPCRRASKAACACGERTTRKVRCGSAARAGSSSAPKRSLPRTLAGASRRATRAPTARPAFGGGATTTRPGRHGEHRLDDLAVAGAAAEHAAERVEHRRLVGIRIRAQQRLRAHQHAGRAGAALRRPVGDEGALQHREAAGLLGQALDRRHRAWRAQLPRATMQAHTASPSTSTVQAPQSPAWQPILVPVRPRSSRSTSERRREGSATTTRSVALTRRRTTGNGLRLAGGHRPASGSAHAQLRQRAPQQRRGGVEAVGGARPEIVDRRQRREVGRHDAGGEVRAERLAEQPGFQRRQAQGARRTAADGDAGARDATLRVGVQDHRDHRHRDRQVAPAAELEEGRAGAPAAGRDLDGHHQLVRATGGSTAAEHEIGDADAALADGAAQHHDRIERHQHRRAVGRGRGIAEVAGDGAGVLDLHAADLARRELQAVEERRQVGRAAGPSRSWRRRSTSRRRPGRCRAARRCR